MSVWRNFCNRVFIILDSMEIWHKFKEVIANQNFGSQCRYFSHEPSLLFHHSVGERTGLVVRASDSGSGDPGSILGRVGVLFP